MPFDFGSLKVDRESVKSASSNRSGGFDFGGLQDRLSQIQRERQEEERRRQLELIQKQNDAIEAFNQRAKEVQEGGILKKGAAWFKENIGSGDTLPVIEGATPAYTAQQQALEASRAYKDEVAGRLGNGIADLFGKAKTAIVKRADEYEKSVEERGRFKTQLDMNIGAAKNIGELASGTAKLALNVSPLTGFSGVRKLIGVVGGKRVEEYLDRSTPEYMKRVDAFIDDEGILNYNPKYSSEIQQTGGEVAEIGSWFIPITRLGKVEKGLSKISGALKDIPVASKILGSTPKLVKVGGKFAFEVSKDVVDVATLDAIRGKDWETIKEDATLAGIGGGVLRSLVGGAKLTGSIPERMRIAKEAKMMTAIEDSIGKLDADEAALVKSLVKGGRPIDDITTDIIERRQSAGTDVITETVNRTDDGVDTLKADAAASKEEVARIAETEKAVPPVADDPLLQEARKYKSAEDFVKAQGTPLYRGATKDSMLRDRGRGTSFSTDRSVAEKFVTNDQTGAPRTNGIMGEFVLPPDAKVLDATSLTASKIKADLNRTNIVKYARESGYDAIRFGNKTAQGTGWASEEEIRVLNHEKIKTKSQLTDLYNQATGGGKKVEAPKTEPKKSVPPKSEKKESVTAKKMNERLDSDKQMSTEYDAIEINKKSNEAAALIEKDKSKAIKTAFSDAGSNTDKVAILNELFEASVKNRETDVMGMLFNRIKQLSTETAQALNMFKALTVVNPHFHYMESIVNARLSKLKLTGSELKAGKLAAKRMAITKEVKSVVRRSYKLDDAQALFDSIICK